MTKQENEKLAELLYPNIKRTVADLEKQFPKRNLSEGAIVTRFAPSPTGDVHIGSLLSGSKARLFAKQSGGVVYLRIEDTDTKREKADATKRIPLLLGQYGITFDEGVSVDLSQYGNYGPYVQSQRKEFYHICAKEMVSRGYAYPCFCSKEDLNIIRGDQRKIKVNTGYYGRFAKCRNLTFEQVKQNLEAGKKFTLRLRAPEYDKKEVVTLIDEVRKPITAPRNFIDDVLIKSEDGLPTYAFAHVVDDHFMRTTHVFRADEWLATWPIHVQMFDMIGFEKPKYVHLSPLMKMVDNSRKKLSKRDGVSIVEFVSVGYPEEAIMDYCMFISFSDFEPWRVANPNAPYSDFKVRFEKLSASGPLLDWSKVNDLSKNIISTWSAEKLFDRVSAWAKEYNKEFYDALNKNKDYSIQVLNMDRCGERIRKDIIKYSDMPEYIGFMFAKPQNFELLEKDSKKVINDYIKTPPSLTDNNAWFEGLKAIATKNGFTTDMKAYKTNPTAFIGSVTDVANMIRVAITGKQKTGDLFLILKVLGEAEILARLQAFVSRP